MGRPKRAAKGGILYDALNRANARMTIFENDGDYEAFERIIEGAIERTEMRLLAYCVMPNHWYLGYGLTKMVICHASWRG